MGNVRQRVPSGKCETVSTGWEMCDREYRVGDVRQRVTGGRRETVSTWWEI